MRVLIAVAALVATPFVAGVSQSAPPAYGRTGARGVGHDALHCAARTAQRPGREINKCPAPTPSDPPPVVQPPSDPPPVVQPPSDPPPVVQPPSDPPPAPDPVPPPPDPVPPPSTGCVASAPPVSGKSGIDGQVFVDASPWPGQANWCVELTGTVSGTVVTDASGNWAFTGLPDGTYTVCEVVQAGWHQTSPASGPACATGVGYTFNLSAGRSASFIWFGNMTTP